MLAGPQKVVNKGTSEHAKFIETDVGLSSLLRHLGLD